eukprot:INCI3580.5.p1 GENE.INCI3580.5~~INCI3580.5.p1  ORF type:complete len:608 (-),score=109.08 INCI3580.5:213-2036(-)
MSSSPSTSSNASTAAAAAAAATGAVRTVHCWSGPRSGSTAFLYSWDARADTAAVDEPLYAHHLSKRPNLFRPYRAELLAAQNSDGQQVLAELCRGPAVPAASSAASSAAPSLLFAKHMAKHNIGLDLGQGGVAGPTQRHVVLIRNPMKQLLSFAAKGESKAHAETSLDELALPQLLDIFHTVGRAPGASPPVVVDYDDLLRDPEPMLRALCQALDVPFDPAMLSWKAGPKECDGLWASYWYQSVHKSTHFDASVSSEYKTLPAELMPVLRAAMPFYQALSPHRIKPALAFDADDSTAGTISDHGLDMSLYPDPRNHDIVVWIGTRDERCALVPREHARISVFDSTVQGGDAVWEGLRVYRGKIFKLDRHIRRLHESARAMGFSGVHTADQVKHAIFMTLAANGMRDDVHIRLTLSRGDKTTSSMNPKFNVFGCTLIVLAEFKPVVSVATYDNQKGVSLITAAGRRNPPMCVDSKIHHNNLINNIIPKMQANLAGAADAIMLDVDGFVSETNATNIFMVKCGVLLTPHADHCLPGITRETVLLVARELGFDVVERRISLAEFHAADEVFTTGGCSAAADLQRSLDVRCNAPIPTSCSNPNHWQVQWVS